MEALDWWTKEAAAGEAAEQDMMRVERLWSSISVVLVVLEVVFQLGR